MGLDLIKNKFLTLLNPELVSYNRYKFEDNAAH